MPASDGPREWTAAESRELLMRPQATSDKYSRGVLGVRTGSARYPGAAVLGVQAAWRTGLGLLRFVPPIDEAPPVHGLPGVAAAVLAARPETVIADPFASHSRVSAWLAGSGTETATRSFAEREWIARLLDGEAPVVLDAGALDLVVRADRPRAATIITPHRGEFLALWREVFDEGALPAGWGADRARMPEAAALVGAARTLAARLGVAVLLKGSLTVAATPAGWATAIDPATPWLATAGTGDVLAGVLGALAACCAATVPVDAELLGRLGASAALIHDTAARIASGPGELRPITALDVAEALPRAIAAIAAAD